MTHDRLHTLPSGGTLDVLRARSAGILDAEQLDHCRRHDVPVGYDPIQIGWVALGADDDLTETSRRGSSGPRHAAMPPDFASRFAFRPWEPSDLDTYERILGNRTLWTYMTDPYPEPFTREVAAQLLEISRTGEHHEVRALEHQGEVVGQVRLTFDDRAPERRIAEVSYWLDERHWRKGLMSKALTAYTIESFRGHAFSEIHAWIHRDNLGSAKAAERAGYRRDTGPDGASHPAGHAGFVRWIAHRADYV
jgi:RimJ/RimL family protein N-acetyltransferase